MKKVAIHGISFKPEVRAHLVAMLQYLEENRVELQISTAFAACLKDAEIAQPAGCSLYKHYADLQAPDFMFSVGGDGTLLECVTHVGERQTPILGINTGRLGFLATTSPPDIVDALCTIFKGYYKCDERSLLKIESDRDLFDGINFGLNDFTITKRDTSSMIVVHTYIDGEYLNSYWADGVIVATPTGSTGYSLSCGGPVVLPESNNFVISPVSPHNLNVRPMVVSDNSTISFGVEGRSKNFLVSLDSRSRIIDSSDEIAVRKANFKAKLIKLKEDHFLNTLRNKLNWGLDARN